MNTQTPEVDLDKIVSGHSLEIGEGVSFVRLRVSVARWREVAPRLLALRSDGVGFLLRLVAAAPDAEDDGHELEDEEMAALFQFLYQWQQMSVENFLAVCGDWLPQAYLKPLQQETMLERKSLEQWHQAANDRQFVRYPALPWRRFLRTVNDENFDFVQHFLALSLSRATDTTKAEMDQLLKAFLLKKKNPVSIFPKAWSKTEKGNH